MATDAKVIELALSELLKLLYHRRTTCMVGINDSRLSGEIYLRRGQIVHASTDRLVGDEALAALLSEPRRDYEVMLQTPAPRRTIRESTQAVLQSVRAA